MLARRGEAGGGVGPGLFDLAIELYMSNAKGEKRALIQSFLDGGDEAEPTFRAYAFFLSYRILTPLVLSNRLQKILIQCWR